MKKEYRMGSRGRRDGGGRLSQDSKSGRRGKAGGSADGIRNLRGERNAHRGCGADLGARHGSGRWDYGTSGEERDGGLIHETKRERRGNARFAVRECI